MPTEFDDLTRTTKDRRSYFTLPWFRKLFAGELSLGDTFWAGNFGVLLFVVPAFVLLTFLFVSIGSGQGLFSVSAFLVMAVYFAALARAVFIAARKSPQARGWRWVAVGFTALVAVLLAVLAFILLTAPPH